MTRTSRWTAVLIAAAMVVAVGPWASAQQGQPQVRVQVQAGGTASYAADYFAVPGYFELGREDVQKEIGLTDEQREKLEAISKKYRELMRQGAQPQDWSKWKDLSEEERKNKIEEMRKKASAVYKKRQEQTEALRKEVEGVLTADQLEALHERQFRQRAGYMLLTPTVQEALGLSKKQKSRLEAGRKRLQQRMRTLQEKSRDQALRLLTPEQMAKLKKLSKERYRSVWSQGQGGARSIVRPGTKEQKKQ